MTLFLARIWLNMDLNCKVSESLISIACHVYHKHLFFSEVINALNARHRYLQSELNDKVPLLLRHPFRGRQIRAELDCLEKDIGHGNQEGGKVYETQKEILNCIVSLSELFPLVCLSRCSPSFSRGLARHKKVFVLSRSFKVRF
jgi:hypothetical protein